MSNIIRTSGKVALPALIVIGLIAALVGVQYFARSAPRPGSNPAGDIDDDGDTYLPPLKSPTFKIGPIDGLTTGWHQAPPATSIPLGTIVQFHQEARSDWAVTWTGANELARNAEGSTAVCALVEQGTFVVQVEVVPGAGQPFSKKTIFTVVDIPADQITVSPIEVWVDPFEIDETLPQDELNEATMGYFFGPSIAALTQVGPGEYRTSVGRSVHMSVKADPPGFAPVIEWRFNDQAPALGLSDTVHLSVVGNKTVAVGPVLNPAEIEIETYSVTITSHVSGEDIVPEGESITFEAVTNPPGYEDEIIWLSSTKYGTAYPVLGVGPQFTAEFNDTFGPWPVYPDVSFQWLGVKAGNALLGQDQKRLDTEECGCVAEGLCPDEPLYCLYTVNNVQGGDCGNLPANGGTLCYLCDANFPMGDCPNFTGTWRNFDCNGNVNCTGTIVASQGIACDTCPAADSKKVVVIR